MSRGGCRIESRWGADILKMGEDSLKIDKDNVKMGAE
jgi:hypothetical protein